MSSTPLVGVFSHLDSRGDAVDLYRDPDGRVLIGTAQTGDDAAPAVLTNLNIYAATELHSVLGAALDEDPIEPDPMEQVAWERAMDERIGRLAVAAGVSGGGWEVVIESVIEKLQGGHR